MKIKLILALILISLVPVQAHSQIITQDNQKISYVEEIKLSNFVYGLIFKTYDNQYYIQSKLLHSLNKEGYVVLLEDAKLSFDNSTFYIPIRTSEVYCGFRQKFSIKLHEEAIEALKTNSSLSITLPYYKDGSDLFVQYKTIDIPPTILEEWKSLL